MTTKRERLLTAISAACSQRLVYLSILEGETLRRDGIEAWRALARTHRAEKMHLLARDERVTRLAVRAMYAPQERRARDEEMAAERADQRMFGLRAGEREVSAWEFEL